MSLKPDPLLPREGHTALRPPHTDPRQLHLIRRPIAPAATPTAAPRRVLAAKRSTHRRHAPPLHQRFGAAAKRRNPHRRRHRPTRPLFPITHASAITPPALPRILATASFITTAATTATPAPLNTHHPRRPAIRARHPPEHHRPHQHHDHHEPHQHGESLTTQPLGLPRHPPVTDRHKKQGRPHAPAPGLPEFDLVGGPHPLAIFSAFFRASSSVPTYMKAPSGRSSPSPLHRRSNESSVCSSEV